jgi:hypothetical protein
MHERSIADLVGALRQLGARSDVSRRMVSFGPMEHRHRCLYCHHVWFCYESCPPMEPSVCPACAESRRPDMPVRVIPLTRVSRKALDWLIEAEGERLRDRLRRGRA